MSYVSKYRQGAITNSMLEAVESCPFKFHKLYVERAKIEGDYEKVLDSLSLGILCHEVVEVHPLTMAGLDPVDLVFAKLADWPDLAAIRPYVYDYVKAVAMTQAFAASQNREPYTAPQMTSYWKRSFPKLSEEAIFKIDSDIKNAHPDWMCDIAPFSFALRAVNAVTNYKNMLPKINHNLKHKGSELTFHVDDYLGETLAGTIDRLDTDEQGRIWITDWKSGNNKYDFMKVLNLNQPNLYALSLRLDGHTIGGYRIGSLESGTLVSCGFDEKAFRVFVDHRLPRLIHSVKIARNTPVELLPVLAGRSWSLGCPCELALLPEGNPHKCPAYYIPEDNK